MTGATEHKKRFRKGGFKGKEGDKQPPTDSENDSPIVKLFRKYSSDLVLKHDKHERIVKISRDITIVSKRIIFSIHGLLRSENVDEDVQKINDSLKGLRDNQFKAVRKELLNEDPYQFVKAYMWGLQEFVEAITFFRFVREGRFCDYDEVVAFLEEKNDESDGEEDAGKLLIPVLDYVLGLGDLTGELMRHCIETFSGGRSAEGGAACAYGRRLYAGFLCLMPGGWGEYNKKVSVAKQSIEKMEYASYTFHVRGSEMPPAQETVPIFD